MDRKKLLYAFRAIFGSTSTPKLFFAPGRINVIGEHTDYNGGHVLPASISFGTYAIATKREDCKLRFYSMNFSEKGIIECELSNVHYDKNHDWANYPKGMFHYMIEEGFNITTGADILFYGNIPNGAGLSSSASIEMVTGVAIESLYNICVDRIRVIQLGQRIENEYIGVNSGIMDQFAIGMGKKNHAILLDCQTLDYRYAPLSLPNHAIVIMNTNKRRELAGSNYNDRRAACERALADLQTRLTIDSLGEVSIQQFEEHKSLIKSTIDQKRAKHAVYESQRTLIALEQLENGNLEQFGQLMNESHHSLRDDYEVTGKELDTLVEAAWQQDGVIGARMTGAGFGGCAIALVEREQVDTFSKVVNRAYKAIIGYDATFYVASISDGAKEITREEML